MTWYSPSAPAQPVHPGPAVAPHRGAHIGVVPTLPRHPLFVPSKKPGVAGVGSGGTVPSTQPGGGSSVQALSRSRE